MTVPSVLGRKGLPPCARLLALVGGAGLLPHPALSSPRRVFDQRERECENGSTVLNNSEGKPIVEHAPFNNSPRVAARLGRKPWPGLGLLKRARAK